jgi:hypothetical protein
MSEDVSGGQVPIAAFCSRGELTAMRDSIQRDIADAVAAARQRNAVEFQEIRKRNEERHDRFLETLATEIKKRDVRNAERDVRNAERDVRNAERDAEIADMRQALQQVSEIVEKSRTTLGVREDLRQLDIFLTKAYQLWAGFDATRGRTSISYDKRQSRKLSAIDVV